MVIDGREEVPPKLEILECQGVRAIGEVGEVKRDGDAMPRGLGAVDGGGCGLEGGGKRNFGWCVDGNRGDNGAVPMRGSWSGEEL